MKRAERGHGAGYTILETIIFLAVSAAMFVSAMAFVNGRQNRTEFSTAVRDFESVINDIANDVSDGYYANATSGGQTIRCYLDASGNVIIRQQTTNTQGGNQGCIFIGKALQFRPDESSLDDGQYLTYTLVGKQYKNGQISYGDSTSYADSGVKAIVRVNDNTPDAYGTTRLGGGVTIGCVLYTDGTVPATYACGAPNGMTAIDTVAFMTTFQAANLSDADTKVGSASVNLVVPSQGLNPPTVRRSIVSAVTAINGFTDLDGGQSIVTNPKGGVFICLQSNGTAQHAWVSIGGASSRFSTNTQIVGGGC